MFTLELVGGCFMDGCFDYFGFRFGFVYFGLLSLVCLVVLIWICLGFINLLSLAGVCCLDLCFCVDF